MELPDDYKPVPCDLQGDGNAFAILGRVKRALTEHGYRHLVAEYFAEATKGDYNHLLQVSLQLVYDPKDEVES